MICRHDWENIKTICCEHIKCKKCGVIKKINVCDFHKDHLNSYDDKNYFLDEKNGMFKDNIPLNKLSCEEHIEAFSKVGLTTDILEDKSVLEVGAGIGRIIPLLNKYVGYYFCVEPNKWACDYIENSHYIVPFNNTFEEFYSSHLIGKDFFDIVFCIHTLEHFKDADKVFEQLIDLIDVNGYLFIEVPDNRDLYNPDHYWFFDESVLRHWASLNNLEEIGCYRKSIIEKEDFIYFLWRKK